MATPTPPPPNKEPENNHQPSITTSPPHASVHSPLQYDPFTNSLSSPSPPHQPDNAADDGPHPPPENSADGEHQPVPPSPPPEEAKFVDQQSLEPPPPPPPTETEQPPETLIPKQPSPSPLTPPTGAEDPVKSSDYGINPNPNPTPDHESPVLNQPMVSGPEDPVASPNYRKSPNLDNEFHSPSSPAKNLTNPSPKPNQSPKEMSPSPPPTTGSPSSFQDTPEPDSNLAPLLGLPLLHAGVAKPQISPWTPEETANLIQAYQEKWYSLKKGSLKAGQWEEVAITVAARCGYDEPTKTAKQCRHKLEKLRKRYRAERGKPRSKAIAWNFFKLMDNLEKGPLPISSTPPMALVEYQQKPGNSNGKKRKNAVEDDEDDDGDGEYLVSKRSSRSKSYNHHVPDGYLTRNLRFSDGGSRVVRGLRTPVVHKHKGFYKEDDGEDEEEDEVEEQGGGSGVGEEGVAAQLAVEIKGFAEKFVKMENKKIEMMRDVERYRLEMENKRMEMILESQQMLIETVNKAFHKTHKLSAN